ncbi:hypothetical protein VTO42DRAFT_1472 [Malbranchea cinnamomea]
MWLWRGAQSAIFYYAVCTPCKEQSYKRRRKREAAKSRETSRDDLVTEQPRSPFHQPSPFSTNPYWSEEIALGPGPPARKAGHRVSASRTGSQKNLASPDGFVDPKTVAGVISGLKGTPKKDKDRAMRAFSDRWNKVRYQREDEELWGTGIKGSSVGLSGPRRVDTDGSTRYDVPRREDMDDMRHPVIVLNPRSKAETRWMLQPPPSANLMAGKTYPRSERARPKARVRPPFANDDPLDERDEDQGDTRSSRNQDNASPPILVTIPEPERRSRSTQPPAVISSDEQSSRTLQPHESPDGFKLSQRPPLALLAAASSTKPGFPQLNSRSRSTSPADTPRTKSQSPATVALRKPCDTHCVSNETLNSDEEFQLLTPAPPPQHSDIDRKQVHSLHLEFSTH